MRRFKIVFIVAAGIVISVFAVLSLSVKSLYTRKTLDSLTFEPDYYWAEEKADVGKWDFRKTYAGYDYFLYIPPEYKKDRHDESLKVPLVVLFHGSSSKGSSLGRFGRIWTDSKIQSIRPCAVLVLLARCEYYSDCHDTSMLIQNLILQNECIDRKNIIAYGHSQGAYYAVKMACYQPELFKAVISGSGYYQITKRELLKVLPIQFWFGISKNDSGIYEQGCNTGRLLAKYCKNSVYAEYETKGHFWIEPSNVSPTGEVFLEWLDKVLNGE